MNGDFAFVVVNGDDFMAARSVRGKTLIWFR
jgi:hypothetical protein